MSITRAGRAVLTEAVPLWREAQKQMNERLSATTWDSLFRGLPKVAEAAAG